MSGGAVDWLSLTARAVEAWKAFIVRNGLRFEGIVPERIAVIYDNGEIRACAALDGCIVKYIAVDENERDSGTASRLVSFVVQYALSLGRSPLFLFTVSKRAPLFCDMGFGVVSSYAGISLLEYPKGGADRYSRSLVQYKSGGTNGAVVMNANPFTKGHRYLIEKASEAVDRLHVFLVREDLSVFPYETRLSLVREGTQDISNVCIHKGGRYVLSGLTFPAYFSKISNDYAVWQSGLDVSVFSDYIVSALNIKVRFVGDEKNDALTHEYNRKMHEILEPKGVDVIELPRLCIDGMPVSAGHVRRLIESGNQEYAKRLLPDCTVRFIDSSYGKEIIGRL